MSEGFLTVAYGAKEYMRMAKALALSYRRYKPSRPFAIVTDEAHMDEMRKYFDIVIPFNPQYGKGVVQKLHLDLYTPFDNTVFIDSDCLFYKNPELVWNSYNQGDFTMRGWRHLTGNTEYEQNERYLFLDDVAETLTRIGITRLPHFNSGVMQWKKSEKGNEMFAASRRIYENAGQLGFVKFKNAPLADEPVFAIAMEQNGVELYPWNNVNGQETAIGMDDKYGINVLEGRSKFVKNGVEVEPAIIHFNSGGLNVIPYLKDVCRLECEKSGLSPKLAGLAATWSAKKRTLLNKARKFKKKILN